MDTDFSHTH